MCVNKKMAPGIEIPRVLTSQTWKNGHYLINGWDPPILYQNVLSYAGQPLVGLHDVNSIAISEMIINVLISLQI